MKSILEKYCSEKWLKYIDSNKKIIKRKANEIVFAEGDPVQGIYFIDTGKVKVVQETAGKDPGQSIVRLAASGDILGHRGFGGDGTYPVSAISLEPTRLVFLTNNDLESIALGNPNFTFNLMKFFAEELRASEEKASHAPAKCRIAKAIVNMHDTFGLSKKEPKKLNYTLSRSDIASFSNTAYETLLRTLNEWRRSKIIDFIGKEIVIKDIKALKNECLP